MREINANKMKVNKKVPKKTRKWCCGRGILKVVKVVSTWGNRKAISGGMGTDVRSIYLEEP
jgi:hypothetical protein